MADGALYTGTVGAKNLLRSMRLIANNLANINSIGFHADYETVKSHKVKSSVMHTRVMPMTTQTYTDLKPGPIHYTGRELDVAIEGAGYIAVQTKTGQVGYTRNGSFDISPQGFLVTKRGDLVLGANGVITIPPAARVSIDKAGVVSAQLNGEAQNTIAEVGRMKLVELPSKFVTKGEDGLYYSEGQVTTSSPSNIKLVPESLEGSNVDPIRSLVELIELSRQFDMHTKGLKSVEDNASKANKLLDIQS